MGVAEEKVTGEGNSSQQHEVPNSVTYPEMYLFLRSLMLTHSHSQPSLMQLHSMLIAELP